MIFILLLFLAALSIAGSAAYFSVYGLANTFHGTFWSVVIMGGSLEIGKLIAASYLYRYWKKTQFFLKSYLIIGVIALMILTSTGVFGYLSSGYQTDVLPLKQIEQQVQLLDSEKNRLMTRKVQIDNQIANLPSDYSRSRVKLMNAFKTEQEQVTNRINQLDKEILDLKTKIIQTEAHIGPITYIAKAFHLNTDDATKYLVYLIIFAFDPMAVALTLAVNISLRVRKEEKEGINNDLATLDPPLLPVVEEQDPIPEENTEPAQLDHSPSVPLELEPIVELEDSQEVKEEPIVYNQQPYVSVNNVSLATTIPKPPINEPDEPDPIEEEITQPTPIPAQPYVEPPPHRIRPYTGLNNEVPVEELLRQYNYYKRKEDQGDRLAQDEIWAFNAVKNALHQKGYNVYI